MTKPTLKDIKAELDTAVDDFVTKQEPVLLGWSGNLERIARSARHLPKGKVEAALARAVTEAERRIAEIGQ